MSSQAVPKPCCGLPLGHAIDCPKLLDLIDEWVEADLWGAAA